MKQLKFRKIDIETYKPGKSRIGNIKNLIKLSANESALGFSSKIKKNSFNNKKIDKYPDGKCKILRKQILINKFGNKIFIIFYITLLFVIFDQDILM